LRHFTVRVGGATRSGPGPSTRPCPRILERLRPKHGRMCNVDDAQPGGIRLLALSVRPSLTSR
jgi:hypothetical protein